MALLIGFFAFLFGAAVGSFLNVVVLRLHTGRGLGGRSSCPSCDRTLAALELIPIVSFVALSGRCRTCRATLSLQYPLVELVTGVLFAGLVLRLGVPQSLGAGIGLLLWAAAISLLVAIVAYDMRHHIIPDALSYALSALAIGMLVVTFEPLAFTLPSLSAVAAGPAMALPLFAFWFFSGGRWMGLGDAKLALGLGWLLGLAEAISALVISFWVGAVVSIVLLALSRSTWRLWRAGNQLTMKSEVPFAPFLIIGTLLVFFFGVDVIGLSAVLG